MSSFCKRKRIPEKGHSFERRIWYLQRIAEALWVTPQLFPRPDQERLYQKALAHVVHVLSAKPSTLSKSGTVVTDNEDGHCNENEYVQGMKEILAKLQCMERGRLYDPPYDYEIGYYLLLKKYSRPFFTFRESQTWGARHESVQHWHPFWRGLACFSPYLGLHFVEELVDVTSHMEHISANLSEMIIQNGFSVKPLLGISTMEKDKIPPVICGSKERSNMFYHHKFMLALIDLRSSHHAFSPPSPGEKECFNQVLLHIEPSSSDPVIDNMGVSSHRLQDLFIETLRDETVRFEKDCTRITLDVLKKVSIDLSEETLLNIIIEYDDNAKERDETVVNCYKEMLEQCDISYNDLPDYIGRLAQAIEILVYFVHLNVNLLTLSNAADELLSGFSDGWFPIEDSFYDKFKLKNIGWEVLHVLAFFRYGSSFAEMEVTKDILQKCYAQGTAEPEAEKGANVNVETLKSILNELRLRGVEDWDLQSPPTCEELLVLHQILRSIVCTIHFFNCAKTYQQRTEQIKIGQNNAVFKSRKSARERKKYIGRSVEEKSEFPTIFSRHHCGVNKTINLVIFILQGFRDGLVEKLNKP